MKIAVIMPVHNQQAHTILAIRCMEAAARMEESVKLRLILVDNASKHVVTPDTLEHTVIRNTENHYFARAVNQGATLTEPGEHLCILNNDVMLRPDFFRRYKDFYEQHKPEISGPLTNCCFGLQNIGSKIPDKYHIEFLSPWDEQIYNQLSCIHDKLYIDEEFTKHIPRDVMWVNGFCMFLAPGVFQKYDKFDATTFPLSGEEIDFCYRAYSRGAKIMIDRQNFCWHFKHATAKEVDISEAMWNQGGRRLRERWKMCPKQDPRC